MAASGDIPALISAFFFGILIAASAAALIIQLVGHGLGVFRNGLRLVLVLFLASATLWSLTEFLSTLVDPVASSSCQVAVIFSTLFDQFARSAVEQYLLWSTVTTGKASVWAVIAQVVLFARFVVGMVFVGESKAQFGPTCVPVSNVAVIGIVVIVLDAVILTYLAIQNLVTPSQKDGMEDESTAGRKRNVLLTIVGFAIWTGTSLPLLLGASTIATILRTAMPAIGELVLVVLMLLLSESIISTKPRAFRPPKSPTPQNYEREQNQNRDLSSSDSTDYPPSRYEDLKAMDVVNTTAVLEQSTEVPDRNNRNENGGLPKISRPITGVAGVGGLPIQGQLFPPPRAMTQDAPSAALSAAASVSPLAANPVRAKTKKPKKTNGGKLVISNPVIATDDDSQNPLNKITTIDLTTAAQLDRERRENLALRSSGLIATRPAPLPPTGTPQEGLNKTVSLRRKDVEKPAVMEPLPSVEKAPVTGITRDVSTKTERTGITGMFRSASAKETEAAVPNRSRMNKADEIPVTGIVRSDSAKSNNSSTPGVERSDSTKTIKTAGGLSVEGNASSTSTQLSPGIEALKRRSPRNPIPATTPFQIIRPGEPLRIPIPRAKTPVADTPAKTPEPVKTPLQRRPTTGLPSNPRAQGRKTVTKEARGQRQETVMFINNIEYDDPIIVNDIIQEAAKASPQLLKSSNSVVHRPRPIPRKSDKDRQVFPAEVSMASLHRRSRSVGSVRSRRSILESLPGSPTQLPPLPPLPPAPEDNDRPQPNDTKSMTFDEKMAFMYPRSPSASSTAASQRKRRSSVPSLPSMAFDFTEAPKMPEVPDVPDMPDIPDGASRRSKTTDRSSARTQSLLGIEDSVMDRYTPALPTETRQINAADELGNSWLPGIAPDVDFRAPSAMGDAKRKSSPVIPQLRDSALSSVDMTASRDGTTNWGSVHSPVAAVNLQERRANARSTYIQNEGLDVEPRPNRYVPSGISKGDQVMTVMLDTSSQGVGSRDSFYLEDDQKPLPKLPVEAPVSGQWHHRVGDDCPTFSARQEKMRSRMPPPTPLLLKTMSTRRRPTVVQEPEPAPLESPSAAYNMIQSQLEKFEQPVVDTSVTDGQRLALLDNLEEEMGQQRHKWQAMQQSLDRNSFSTVQSSPANSRPPSTVEPAMRPPSQRSMAAIVADRRATKFSIARSHSKSRADELSTPSSQSSQSSENSKASQWQARLASAQMEYMDKAPDLLKKRNNLNFLAVRSESATPPETDDSASEGEQFKNIMLLSSKVFKASVKKSALWKPQNPVQQPGQGGLWTRPAQVQQRNVEQTLVAESSLRPTIRKHTAPLTITSSQLWEKSIVQKMPSNGRGLWKKYVPPPVQRPRPQPVARPLTQRPPRRSKRITMLADIVESPKELPDKRGTLGIFQLPWGETSESASIVPRQTQVFMAMPGTMTSGGPTVNAAREARARELEATEYSSSFFDDYEDEESGDNIDDSSEDDVEDDDFDEETLKEIASLLQTEKLPSKNSLLPRALESPIDDYASEFLSTDVEDQEDDNQTEDFEEEVEPARIAQKEPFRSNYVPPLMRDIKDQPRPQQEQQQPTSILSQASAPLLWASNDQPRQQQRSSALPQPDEKTWQTYAPEMETARAQIRSGDALKIQSTSLWGSAKEAKTVRPDGLMWMPEQTIPEPVKATPTATKPKRVQTSKLLWQTPSAPAEPEVEGLFSVNHVRVDLRRTSKEAAAISMIGNPRASHEELPKLESTQLWISNRRLTTDVDWISMSSIAPRSPSAASVASDDSFPSSADTDASSIKSTATKASSFFGSVRNASGVENKPSKRDRSGSASSVSSAKAAMIIQPVVPPVPMIPEEFTSKDLGLTPASPSPSPQKPAELPRQRDLVREDWDTALEEAIKASHIPPRILRRTASPGEWGLALKQAIAASHPDIRFSRGQVAPSQWGPKVEAPILGFDASRRHPAFATSSLTITSATARAAAQGRGFDPSVRHPAFAVGSDAVKSKTVRPAANKSTFDVSKKHPVFAASSLATKASVSHPAATGYTYDVTTRHPMFFGSAAAVTGAVEKPTVSKAKEEQHQPKQQGLSKPLMWSKPAQVLRNVFWTAPESGSASMRVEDVAALEGPKPRSKQVAPEDLKIDVNFGVAGMWKQGDRPVGGKARAQNINWLG